MDPSPAAAERDRRLGRLQHHVGALVNAYGALLALAAVNDGPGATDVDTARLRATTAALTAHVDGLLALIRELRLDVFVHGASAAADGVALPAAAASSTGADAQGADVVMAPAR
jgi:hypothetical protein